MAYLDNVSPRDRATSIATVIAVHAALGYALVIGLQATGVIPERERIEAFFIKDNLPKPPPPPDPVEDPRPTPQQSQVYTPPVPTPLVPIDPGVTTTVILPPITPNVVPSAVPSSIPEVPSGLLPPVKDPIAAKPRGNPGSWIGEQDYRTSWINRDLRGIAGFRLSVGADGRVTGCEITRSTGHGELDAATCALLQRRARFEPARDGTGARTSGTFASSVEWRIPD
jgi:periplasmic protein TonB